MKYLFAILASLISLSLSAQTVRQKGVVRLITNSVSSPIVPVGGVKVVVGNNLSKPSADNGAFSVQVPNKFQVNGVAGGDYILALPTKGKDYFASKNDLDVVVTTKTKKEADYKRLYSAIQKKYNQQAKEVLEMRRKCKSQLDEMDSTDKQYSQTKQRLDSLQSLYMEYVNHEEAVEKEMRRIAEELAITDYVSLDSLSRRIYELKCQGEWQSISDLIQTVIGGDLADYINEAVAEKQRTEAQLQQAKQQAEAVAQDLAARFHFVEEAIEALKMQHLNDSVSRMYQILTDAAPDNWLYLNAAGVFEEEYMADYSKSVAYHQRAIATHPAAALLASSYCNLGAVSHRQENDELAMQYFTKAYAIWMECYGEKHPDVAGLCSNMGMIYKTKGDYAKALDYYQKALVAFLAISGEVNSNVAMCYNNIANVFYCLKKYDDAMVCHLKTLSINQRLFGETHPNIAVGYLNIGIICKEREDYASALEYFKKAKAIALQSLGANHPVVSSAQEGIDHVSSKVNRP